MFNYSYEDYYDDAPMEYLCPETFNFNTLSGAFFIVIFIFSLIGNTLLLCVLFIYENLKNVTNVFILNLACSDLIFTGMLPFWAVNHLHHWIFGDFACKFKTALYYIGLYSSIILLTAMTVDRFIMVVLHNSPRNPANRLRCAMVSCAAVWIISIAAAVSDAIKVEVVSSHWNSDFFCEDASDKISHNLGYYLQVSLLFILPFTIVVFCYSAILRTVLQASNRKRYKTVVVVFCIVTAFFICWGPYHILIFMSAFYEPKGCYASDCFNMAYYISRILAYSHCCLNPLLYMLSQKLQRHLLQLLKCNKDTRNHRERGNGLSSNVSHNVAFTTKSSAVMVDEPSK
ncbi:chemokine XC receptor 1-like [Notolabrus celidotus]|uniref:chemokine XC receptor 1-like n=1 Tax=Notolabrus celidotus TaxID=1203425 RepID=UPI00148F7751|nr:chemokine XC receptor 1-like [Notolabrus celidotus]